ncbi:hypothetical protein FC19_GL001454 [Liquorilactobacillus aquaticus DSM 21051]|uniref:Uncharacterized protein n=1 Tax=Liquorilactobacillus aquaticus DSM 21051 TaxID=1423725 RepID=A0A0R2CX03_9LACO|nr:hypothetical protein [Liquorilactobacillus aquaticus]KRM95973.1 hypothetical protein FC19_GL001454 [Liquorilactobacillus aquaticus DSM 21051]
MAGRASKFVDKNGEILKRYDSFVYRNGLYIILSQGRFSVTVEGLKPKETWGRRNFDEMTLRTMCVKAEKGQKLEGE